VKRVLVAVATLLLLAVLAGCGSASGSGSNDRTAGTASESKVDVSTAALRRLHSAAGVAPCRPGTSHSRLPDVTLPCLGGGKNVNLRKLNGPLVINLFAQWCGPCRSELPYYQELHRKAKGKVDVVGVDYLDTQPGAALQLVKDTGVTYPLLADPAGNLRQSFRVRGLPGIVMVDAAGNVAVQFRVFRSYAELRDLVQQQLHVRVPA
jgi:thiol-disulfide isomerase/thioredoxin